jgi:hypothetical protein
VTRAAAVALLALAVVAGRLGVDDELDNLAPALIVGAGWPLLVVGSVLVGPVWRWLDPWDTIARPFTRAQGDAEPGPVWPATVVAVGWVWYLSAYEDPLDPRSVGAILAVYTIFTVGGCLAFGRTRWLGTSEPLGILLSWLALLPRGRLTVWKPPRGAEALLGVFAGGVLFGAVRRSELWGSLNTVQGAEVVAGAGLVGFCAAAAGLLLLMAVAAEQLGARAAATHAAVPAVAAIVVAVALDRNRLSTSIQLLPELFGDPLGRGWDVFGEPGVDPDPLGTKGLLALQLGLLALGHVVASVVLARHLERLSRGPVAFALSALASASVIALVSH